MGSTKHIPDAWFPEDAAVLALGSEVLPLAGLQKTEE